MVSNKGMKVKRRKAERPKGRKAERPKECTVVTHERNGIKLLRFSNLAGEAGLAHAVSTRQGGVSPAPYASLNLDLSTEDPIENPAENLRRLCAAVQVPFERTVRMRQVHTANARVIGPDFEFPVAQPFAFPDTDALVTNVKRVPLLALSADCALTVFYDPARSALAVIHSGWRGAMLNIYSQVINVMRQCFGTEPGNLIVGVSPMISAENYPVKEDFIKKFQTYYPGEVTRKCLILKAGQLHFSLKHLLKHQLDALSAKKYEFANLCTYANKDLFYSWRRDAKSSGRFALIASLT